MYVPPISTILETFQLDGIFFRRNEPVAIHKTRASHATFSDTPIRLQNEPITAFGVANGVIARETPKNEVVQSQQEVWNQRILFSDLKRKLPTLSTKEDEELLIGKERVPKKPKIEPCTSLKLRTTEATPQLEPHVRPKERAAAILQQSNRDMAKVKERDYGCRDDQVENSLQPQPSPLPQRHFKVFRFSSSSEENSPPRPRATVTPRRCLGCGGHLDFDRQVVPPIVARPVSRGPFDSYLTFGCPSLVDRKHHQRLSEIIAPEGWLGSGSTMEVTVSPRVRKSWRDSGSTTTMPSSHNQPDIHCRNTGREIDHPTALPSQLSLPPSPVAKFGSAFNT